MSFWQPILILLRVRHQVARNALGQNATAFMGTVVCACLLVLPALNIGYRMGMSWTTSDIPHAERALRQGWMLMQGFWLLALLFPGGLRLLGAPPPMPVLRPFGLRPMQILMAEILAGLLDVPGVLAVVLTLPLLLMLATAGLWGQLLVVLLMFVLLALQTGAFARLIIGLGALGGRRLRRATQAPAWAVLLLACLCVGIPPAFASLSNPDHSGSRSPVAWLSSPALNDLSIVTPPGLAAHLVASTRRSDPVGLAGAAGGLALWLGLSGAGALLGLRGAYSGFSEAGAARRPHTASGHHTRSGAESIQNDIRDRFLAQLSALILTEWRLLLRKPQPFLPLRRPATLLLLGAFVFVAPDMGRNPIYNLVEFLGMGTLFYSVLWQMQLLCNRFGSEAGTGALLFSFSVSRRRLLLGKNLALLALLLTLDSLEGIGLRQIAEMPLDIRVYLSWLPAILLTLTALGNLISVIHPFAISRQGRQAGTEPPDVLTVAYVLVGCGVPLLLAPAAGLPALGPLGLVGLTLYATALYTVSLFAAAALLARHEQQIIGRLDRNE